MQLTKGAIGNLINRYKAVLKKCHLMNTFGSLAVAGMLVMGGAGMAVAAGVASVGGTTYEGLAAAVSAATTGQTVKLLQDSTGAGIQIDTGSKNGLTIDLNGHTYTVTHPTVGSPGTKTNGFQLLRACLETSAFIVTRRHVDKKRLCAAAKTREDCQTVPQRSDGQRMGACTSSPAPCFWRRSEAQNRPA